MTPRRIGVTYMVFGVGVQQRLHKCAVLMHVVFQKSARRIVSDGVEKLKDLGIETDEDLAGV